MRDGKLTHEGKIGGLKETELMQLNRRKETEVNKEKCKSKIFQYLYTNQGKIEIPINDIKNSIPNSIIMNLSEHFNDILQELIEENNVFGRIEGELLILN